MPPQARGGSRGRRDPSLLEQQQQEAEQARTLVGQPTDGGEDEPDELDENMQVLFEGDTVRTGVSIPVSLAGMDRYSLIQSEATAHVLDGETGLDTAARARAAMRISFFASIEELEDDLARFSEEQAANQARIDAALRRGQ